MTTKSSGDLVGNWHSPLWSFTYDGCTHVQPCPAGSQIFKLVSCSCHCRHSMSVFDSYHYCLPLYSPRRRFYVPGAPGRSARILHLRMSDRNGHCGRRRKECGAVDLSRSTRDCCCGCTAENESLAEGARCQVWENGVGERTCGWISLLGPCACTAYMVYLRRSSYGKIPPSFALSSSYLTCWQRTLRSSAQWDCGSAGVDRHSCRTVRRRDL